MFNKYMKAKEDENMTISLTQAILLGLFCGIAKCCIPYTAGAFMYNTVIFNAVIVGAVLGDMPHA